MNVIEKLVQNSREKMKDAERELGRLIAAEMDSEQKLQALQAYGVEYRERFAAIAQSGMSSNAWRNYCAFLDKIDETIKAFSASHETRKAETVRGKQSWVERHREHKTFDTLHQRQISAVRRAELRAEQKLTDEHVTQTHARRLADARFRSKTSTERI